MRAGGEVGGWAALVAHACCVLAGPQRPANFAQQLTKHRAGRPTHTPRHPTLPFPPPPGPHPPCRAQAIPLLKASIKKAYGKKGDAVVDMNYAAVDMAVSRLVKIDVPEGWRVGEVRIWAGGVCLCICLGARHPCRGRVRAPSQHSRRLDARKPHAASARSRLAARCPAVAGFTLGPTGPRPASRTHPTSSALLRAPPTSRARQAPRTSSTRCAAGPPATASNPAWESRPAPQARSLAGALSPSLLRASWPLATVHPRHCARAHAPPPGGGAHAGHGRGQAACQVGGRAGARGTEVVLSCVEWGRARWGEVATLVLARVCAAAALQGSPARSAGS